jgi:hypothetical protein
MLEDRKDGKLFIGIFVTLAMLASALVFLASRAAEHPAPSEQPATAYEAPASE